MSFKKVGIILFLVFSLFPVYQIHAQSTNTGFVSGNIWYSKDPFEEGDKIKIYTFVFNPDSRELSGTVIFFDKTVLLGKKDFTIPAKGADDVSVDWTATVGDHTIFAKIENAKFLISKGKYEEVYLPDNETEKSSRTVSKKIISKTTDTKNISTVSTSVADIKTLIEDKTPDFIIKPITSSTNAVEGFRISTNIASDNKKEQINNEIKALDSVKNKTNTKTTTSPLLKPFKYVELFFYSMVSFLLNNKVLFYGICLITIFFILRYIWTKIFS